MHARTYKKKSHHFFLLLFSIVIFGCSFFFLSFSFFSPSFFTFLSLPFPFVSLIHCSYSRRILCSLGNCISSFLLLLIFLHLFSYPSFVVRPLSFHSFLPLFLYILVETFFSTSPAKYFSLIFFGLYFLLISLFLYSYLLLNDLSFPLIFFISP